MSQVDDKLRLLCEELSQHRSQLSAACTAQFVQHQQSMARPAAKVPLVHGMNDGEGLPDLQAILAGRALRSSADRKPDKSLKEIETLLGLPDCVYTSAGVLYPQKNVALLFQPSVEKSSVAEASPWDSGAFGRRYRLKAEQQDSFLTTYRELFRKYCLPAPQYREYFRYYVATYFGSFEQYLSGQKSTFSDKLELLKQDSFGSRIFEVRFQRSLPVSAGTLMAVFVRDKAGNEDWARVKRLLTTFEKEGVHIDFYSHNANLHRRVYDFIHSSLQATS